MTSSGQPSADWLGHAEVRLPAGLVLSFQRYALPESGVIERAPASLGALPVGLSRGDELLLPLARRECFWIGLSIEAAQPVAFAVAVERDDGVLLDVRSGAVWNESTAVFADMRDTPRIEGIRRPDGTFGPLLRDSGEDRGPRYRRLHLWARRPGERDTTPVRLDFVDYPTFTARTGLPAPEPLDPDAGYKGWLLP